MAFLILLGALTGLVIQPAPESGVLQSPLHAYKAL